MAVVSFPVRNKLAYPAGNKAGFNSSHLASPNCYFSAVPGGGPNYINLVTGLPLINQQGSQTNALTPTIDGLVGPGLSAPTGAQSLGIATSATVSNITVAAIFRDNHSASFDTLVALNGGNAAGSLWLNNGAPFFFSKILPVLSAGAHYFVAASTDSDASLNNVFMVSKNLDTGQVFILTGNQGWSPLALTSIVIANDSFNEFANFPIAAGMYSNTSLSLSQLLQWADDPFSFWYPPQARSLVAATAVTPPTTVLYSLMNVG